MAKDPFLLVNLGESESKDLAQVISNDTARKILDFLSKNESATETDIARMMTLPLSTVHYNLQALVKANLVLTEEFHYSEKGKEVLHYSLANKLIIIAPKKVNADTFREKLRGLLPIALISVATAGVIELSSMFSNGFFTAKYAVSDAANVASQKAAPMLAAAREAVPAAASLSAAGPVAPVASQNEYLALWFLAGSVFAILVMAVWYFFSSRKK
jgi:DNA-binding transcriptional ArsR family regulator